MKWSTWELHQEDLQAINPLADIADHAVLAYSF